jgi:hypothetical protein
LLIKELLEKLDRFESLLTTYAYDELTSIDAVGLKQKFESFKKDLIRNIFNEPENKDSSGITNSGLPPKKVFDNAIQTLELLKILKKSDVPKNQESIVHNIELNALVLVELSMNMLNKQNNNTHYEH